MNAYVISADWGQYSDHTEILLCATSSKKRAEELSSKLRRIIKYNNEYKERCRVNFQEPYRASHPDCRPPSLLDFRPTKEFYEAQARCADKFNRTDKDKENFKRLQTEHMKRKEASAAEYKRLGELHFAAEREMQKAEEEWKKWNYNLPSELEEVVEYWGEISAYAYDVRIGYQKVKFVE